MIRFRIDVFRVSSDRPITTLKAEYKLWEDAAVDLHAMGWSPFGTGLTTMWTSEQTTNYLVIRSESTDLVSSQQRDYVMSQLVNLHDVTDGVRIKLLCEDGDTKWMTVDADAYRKIADVLVGKA